MYTHFPSSQSQHCTLFEKKYQYIYTCIAHLCSHTHTHTHTHISSRNNHHIGKINMTSSKPVVKHTHTCAQFIPFESWLDPIIERTGEEVDNHFVGCHDDGSVGDLSQQLCNQATVQSASAFFLDHQIQRLKERLVLVPFLAKPCPGHFCTHTNRTHSDYSLSPTHGLNTGIVTEVCLHCVCVCWSVCVCVCVCVCVWDSVCVCSFKSCVVLNVIYGLFHSKWSQWFMFSLQLSPAGISSLDCDENKANVVHSDNNLFCLYHESDDKITQTECEHKGNQPTLNSCTSGLCVGFFCFLT